MTRLARLKQPRRSSAGFTIIELLVVIAIVAVLVGILLPVLAKAKKAAHLAMSMSNERQLTIAATTYAIDDSEGMWPVVPALEDSSVVLINSFSFGGKSGDPRFWKKFYGALFYHSVETRPLNRYVYPNLILRDPVSDPAFDERLELEFFRDPADVGTFQRGRWGPGEIPQYDPSISSYDDVGTSYHINRRWWDAELSDNRNNPYGIFGGQVEVWQRARKHFTRASNQAPGHFVWLYDQIMDVVSIMDVSVPGFHGGMNKSVAAFMDGHVAYLRTLPGKFEGPGYSLKIGRLRPGRYVLPGSDR